MNKSFLASLVLFGSVALGAPATNPNFGSFLAAFTTPGLSSSLGHLSGPNGPTSGTDYAGPHLQYGFGSQEPGTWVGISTGLIAIAALLRRRRKSF